MRGRHGEGRFEQLAERRYADEATAMRDYGAVETPQRSSDIPVQRKRIDPVAHPHRFLDTHDRLFPKFVPNWDPERAAILRSHDVRDKRHDVINGSANTMTFRVCPDNTTLQQSQSSPNLQGL